MDTETGNTRTWPWRLSERRDILWLVAWVGGLAALWVWDAIFLNAPAFERIQAAFLNSLVTGSMVVIMALLFGWFVGVGLHLLERSESRTLYGLASFAVDVIRSVPQIILVLIGYILLTVLLHEGFIRSTMGQLVWIACTLTLAVTLEVADTVRERINYFRTLDFVDAMLVLWHQRTENHQRRNSLEEQSQSSPPQAHRDFWRFDFSPVQHRFHHFRRTVHRCQSHRIFR